MILPPLKGIPRRVCHPFTTRKLKGYMVRVSAFTGLGTAKVIQQSVVQLRAWILTLQVPGTRTPPDNEDAQCPLSRGRLRQVVRTIGPPLPRPCYKAIQAPVCARYAIGPSVPHSAAAISPSLSSFSICHLVVVTPTLTPHSIIR
jgi:hypothetical protein